MRRKIFIKNFLGLLVPIILPVIILGMVTYFTVHIYIRNNIEQNSTATLNLVEVHMSNITNEIHSLNLSFSSNNQMLYSLDNSFNSQTIAYEDYNMLKVIRAVLSSTASYKEYVQSVYVYTDNKNENFFTTSSDKIENIDNFYDTGWYDIYKSTEQNIPAWESLRMEKDEYGRESTVYSFFVRTQMLNGVIVLNLDLPYLTSLIEEQLPEQSDQFIILDKNCDEVLNTNTSRPLPKEVCESTQSFINFVLDGEKYIAHKSNLDSYEWELVQVFKENELYKVPNTLNLVLVFLIVFLVLTALVIAFFSTKRTTDMIGDIYTIVQHTENKLPLEQIEFSKSNYETALVRNILKTFIEKNQLTSQLALKQNLLMIYQLKILQSQINPHFLINTLSSIYWKSLACEKTKNTDELTLMVQNLSSILSYSLEYESADVLMEEELKYTVKYLQIMQIRYKNEFDIKLDYDLEKIGKLKILKLILQPLVENSINHGIRENDKKGVLKIRITARNRRLRIAIIDNGRGVDKVKLREIRKKMVAAGEESDHIGLYNTAKRLNLFYGDICSVKFYSKENLATAVIIKIDM